MQQMIVVEENIKVYYHLGDLFFLWDTKHMIVSSRSKDPNSKTYAKRLYSDPSKMRKVH